MAVATEVANIVAHRPAYGLLPLVSPVGNRDSNLIVVTSTLINASGNSAAIDVEGGRLALMAVRAEAYVTTPNLTIVVQASVDNGATYFSVGGFPLLDLADVYSATAIGLPNGWIKRPIVIPSPPAGSTQKATKVRLNYTFGGAGSMTISAIIQPMTSIALDAALNALT